MEPFKSANSKECEKWLVAKTNKYLALSATYQHRNVKELIDSLKEADLSFIPTAILVDKDDFVIEVYCPDFEDPENHSKYFHKSNDYSRLIRTMIIKPPPYVRSFTIE